MMKRALLSIATTAGIVLAALAGASTESRAQQAQGGEMERYGPFFFLPSVPEALIYSGDVGANDLLNLKKALREHPTVTTIILKDNPGGLVHIGLVIAEEVFERGLDTYIPADSYCASACSFIFFAGRNRVAEGKLGVHQISAPELSGAQAQFGVSDIVATLPKYGVAADVLGIMFRTPAEDMYFFSPQEIAKYGINRTGQSDMAGGEPSPGVNGGAQLERQARANPPDNVQPGIPEERRQVATRPSPIATEEKAINAVALIIQAGSAPTSEAMYFAEEFYAEYVDYFQNRVPKSEILKDKIEYFSRWPVRYFDIRSDSLHVKCQENRCGVIGIYDYRVSSPERGANASGTAEFTYLLQLDQNIRILVEDGKVLSR